MLKKSIVSGEESNVKVFEVAFRNRELNIIVEVVAAGVYVIN